MSESFSYLQEVSHKDVSFFYDTRSKNLDAIQHFLVSEKVDRLSSVIGERAYVVLGGDGTFVEVAKLAHKDGVPILGINFGSKGFLLHDRASLEGEDLNFEKKEYPILHADIETQDKHIHGHAFNEFFLSRVPAASALRLSISHRKKELQTSMMDGLMVSTPAGSTGWSRNYGGIPLMHHSGQNLITPLGNRELLPIIVPDKGRIRIVNDTTRDNPLYILADGQLILPETSDSVKIIIERASRGVQLLIEHSYRDEWDKKPYREQGFY